MPTMMVLKRHIRSPMPSFVEEQWRTLGITFRPWITVGMPEKRNRGSCAS
jgi:hypothetical protein